jgi:hypothetical protein
MLQVPGLLCYAKEHDSRLSGLYLDSYDSFLAGYVARITLMAPVVVTAPLEVPYWFSSQLAGSAP